MRYAPKSKGYAPNSAVNVPKLEGYSPKPGRYAPKLVRYAPKPTKYAPHSIKYAPILHTYVNKYVPDHLLKPPTHPQQVVLARS